MKGEVGACANWKGEMDGMSVAVWTNVDVAMLSFVLFFLWGTFFCGCQKLAFAFRSMKMRLPAALSLYLSQRDQRDL